MYRTNELWSSGKEVVTAVPVIVDEDIFKMLRKLDERFKDVEFSVLFKGKYENGEYYVEAEYYIPEQEVSYASVNYKEDLAQYRKMGFIVILHKHPSGMHSFSSTDFEFINKHFPVSLLWSDGKLVAGTAHIEADGKTFVLPAEIYIAEEDIDGIGRIKRAPPKYYTYKSDSKATYDPGDKNWEKYDEEDWEKYLYPEYE